MDIVGIIGSFAFGFIVGAIYLFTLIFLGMDGTFAAVSPTGVWIGSALAWYYRRPLSQQVGRIHARHTGGD